MDEIVKQALAKWPNVPHCYGWLGLDARGNWFLRDEQAQAQGAFGGARPQGKGSLLQHQKLIEFIARNYDGDAQGRWFFQNGPQRVYVELEATPWIWRVATDLSVAAHTGQSVHPRRSVVDDAGHVYLETDLGFGLVHTQDVLFASEAIESGLWEPEQMPAAQLPDRFGYIMSPLTRHAA